jgi:hypothetical protein
VRRDRIHLAKQKPVDSPNAVSGKLRAIEYQGTWVEIALEGASDEEFVINMMTPNSLPIRSTPAIWCGRTGRRPTSIRWSVRAAATDRMLRGRINGAQSRCC